MSRASVRHVLLAALAPLAAAALACFAGCRASDEHGSTAAPAAAAAPSPPVAAPETTAPTIPSPPAATMTDPKVPSPAPAAGAPTQPGGLETATFANGCFWCTEAVLEQLDGVRDVVSGYMGGDVVNPTYQQVCSGETGHAECVQLTFDPAKISYESLLDWFFRSHDPTTRDRQGADVGTQYRSAIFFHSPTQHAAALAAIARHQPKHASPIVTEVAAAERFWPAEEYHQDYFRKHPNQGYCRAVIAPKLKKLGLEDAR